MAAVLVPTSLSACSAGPSDEGPELAVRPPAATPTLPADFLPDDLWGHVGSWRADPEGLLVRLSSDTPEAVGELSVASDGTVVLVTDTSVYSAHDDYVTWRLPEAAVVELLTALDDAGARDTPSTPSSYGDSVSVQDHNAFREWSEGDTAFADLSRAVTAVFESGSRPDLLRQPREWRPTLVGFEARRPDTRGRAPDDLGGYRPWPLTTPITSQERKWSWRSSAWVWSACIAGPGARRLFRTLDGRNKAWLRFDDGRRWEVSVSVPRPGYVLQDTPCAF